VAEPDDGELVGIVRSVCWYTDQEILKRYLGAALRRADLRNFGVIKFLWKRVSEAPVGQGGLIGAPLAATSSVSQKAPVAYPTIAQRNLIELVRWHCLTNLEAVAWHLSRRRASGAQATG
jgi:hypothetical protein